MAYKNKQDQRDAWNRWYQRNKKKARGQRNARRQKRRAYIQKLKKETPCTDCNQYFPYYVMDFDHVTGNKICNVAQIILSGGWQKMLDEIAKCEIVCSNCHRIRTHK